MVPAFLNLVGSIVLIIGLSVVVVILIGLGIGSLIYFLKKS